MTYAIVTLGWTAAALTVVFLVLWVVLELQCWHNRRFLAALRELRPVPLEVWRETDADAA